MEAKEDPQELHQVAPAPPTFPQSNLYDQVMQDIAENSLVRVDSQGSSLSAQEWSSLSHVKSIRISHKIV
jgi:hypothetical protein